MMMPTALKMSFVLWAAAISDLLTNLLLAVGLTRAKQSFSLSILPCGLLLSTTIIFLLHAQTL
jgi:hypothetical protein